MVVAGDNFILTIPAIAADSVKTLERSFVKLAEGIYSIRHKDAPDTFPQGNTTVIIGDREVLVVDSCYLPCKRILTRAGGGKNLPETTKTIGIFSTRPMPV